MKADELRDAIEHAMNDAYAADGMTLRERFRRTMHYEKLDRLPFFEFGYWAETLPAWHEQGLPKEIDGEARAYAYFGIEDFRHAPLRWGLHPVDKPQVIEETDEYVITRGGDGVISQERKTGTHSIPHYIDFPVKKREDWRWFKERLNPDDPARFDFNGKSFKQAVDELNESPFPISAPIGSLLGVPRGWMGFENYAIATIAEPDMLAEMMDDIADCVVGVLKKAFAHGLQADLGGGWEDICFNSGPICTPDFFRREAVPRYKRIISVLNENGCDIAYTDCDGNINALVQGWLDAGVNTMFPVEVHGGSDPVELRRRFGSELRLMGGVDKMVLQADKASIKKELERLKPLVEEGGFIPHVDHRVQPTVPFDNYLYYLDLKRDMFGAGKRRPMY